MALMTGEQYIESIRNINMEIYMFGKWEKQWTCLLEQKKL